MGHACPVCEEPQVDARHLADHLAITASLRGGDHERWLDEHVPDWSDRDAESLGPLVAEHATEIDLDVPEDDEAVAGEATDAGMAGVDPRHSSDARRRVTGSRDRLSERDRAILREAREMTAQMRAQQTADGEEGDERDENRSEESARFDRNEDSEPVDRNEDSAPVDRGDDATGSGSEPEGGRDRASDSEKE